MCGESSVHIYIYIMYSSVCMCMCIGVLLEIHAKVVTNAMKCYLTVGGKMAAGINELRLELILEAGQWLLHMFENFHIKKV